MPLTKKDVSQIKGAVHDEVDHLARHNTADIRKHFVYRDEFENALARLSAIEKKLGIRSGK